MLFFEGLPEGGPVVSPGAQEQPQRINRSRSLNEHVREAILEEADSERTNKKGEDCDSEEISGGSAS